MTSPPRLLARMSLRAKLITALLTLVALALLATGLTATTALRGYLVGKVDQSLAEVAPPVAFELATGRGLDRDGDGPRAGLPGRDVATVYVDPSGQAFQTGYSLEQEHGSTAFPASEIRPGAATAYTVRADDGQWRALTRPLRSRDGSPAGTVTVAVRLSEVSSTVDRLVFLEVAGGLVVLALLAVAGTAVVRTSLRPLVHVEATAEAIAAGDLSQRVPEADPRTEVGRLARSINEMLAQIERAFRDRETSEAAARASEERMRRFVADASHELRTPLTSIRGFAELYRQGAVVDEADRARTMRRIEDEAARMGLLVDDLLLLARLDQQRPLERRPVDLLALAADAVHDARALAPDRVVGLTVLGSGLPPVVQGDEPRLRQVLTNLVGNALTHTPPGTPVHVRVGADLEASRAVVEVADEGPGLDPDQAARVFERFYRAEGSRTRAQGGTGLGLSIVAALVAAHGGKVEVRSAPGQGATFRVLLPLDASLAPADGTPTAGTAAH